VNDSARHRLSFNRRADLIVERSSYRETESSTRATLQIDFGSIRESLRWLVDALSAAQDQAAWAGSQ
jgi:hypothetical protein